MFRKAGKSISILIFSLTLLLTGCATKSEQPGFTNIQKDVAARTGADLHWHSSLLADIEVAEVVEHLLQKPLTADRAAQIALLNNRRIQELYQRLDIAQADLIQAGMLRNPVFESSLLFPLSSGHTEISIGITQQILDIFLIPLRRQVGQSQFSEAKKQVTMQILDLVYRTRMAFFQAKSDVLRTELLRQRVLTAELAYDFMQRLRAAGNITELELHEHRHRYEITKLQLRRAETTKISSSENLNRLMGLWADQIQWEIQADITDIFPEELQSPPDLNTLESRAISASLDLDAARQEILTTGKMLGIQNATALVPEFELGLEAERNSHWSLGPSLSLPLPVFNQGQARMQRHEALLRSQQEKYTALAVEVRSLVREAHAEFESAQDIIFYYQQVMLPLRKRISNETMLQYNAMQADPLDLLLAKDQEIKARLETIQALATYWTARTKIEQLLAGIKPRNPEH
jgi:cobalt-zinc-cadmium efflux system outer membrane protein